MNTHVIITKKAGQEIPRAFLQLALQKFPSCYGIAIQDKDDDGNPLLDVIGEMKSPSLDDLVKTLDACKDVQAMIVLGNLVDNFDKETDIQPFVFQQLGEDKNPQTILALAFEGDFPNYAKPGHTDEFHLWEDFVYPTLMDKHEAAPDLDGFFAKIKSSQFEQALLNPISHRGCAAMLPLSGDVIAYGRNDLGGEFEWGTTSQVLGYGKQTVVDKAVAAGGKFKSRLSAVMGSAAAPAKVEQEHVADPKTGTITIKDKPPSGTKPDDRYTEILVPTKLQGNARNAWIRLMLGLDSKADMPSGHQSASFKVKVPNDIVKFAMEDVTTRDNVRDLAARVKVFQETGVVASGAVKNDAMKEAHKEPAATPAPDQQVQDPKKAVPMDYLPELKADDKKGTVDMVTDWATRPDDKHPSAIDIQRIEAKWPVFSGMMGIKPVDMARWSIKDIKDLGKKYPDSLALAFIEMRRIALDNGAFGDAIKDAIQKQPDKQVEVPSAQPEAPAAKPDGAPPKKSRLAAITGKAA